MMSSAQHAQGNGVGGGTICHILPCSIDEDITAPVAQYFHPTPLLLSTPRNHPAHEDTNDSNTKNDVTIMAAQFRGRGLLCATDANRHDGSISNDIAGKEDCVDLTNEDASFKQPLSKLPSTMVGLVFNNAQHGINNNNNNNNNNNKDTQMQPLTTIETFSQLYNWRHEHDAAKVMREGKFGGTDKEGLNAVLGWCDVAHAVHDAIPLPQK